MTNVDGHTHRSGNRKEANPAQHRAETSPVLNVTTTTLCSGKMTNDSSGDSGHDFEAWQKKGNSMDETPDCPDWVGAILETLYAEVDSGSGLSWLFDPEEQELIFAPPVVELKGGAHDGREVFSFYYVQLHSIFMLFDEVPNVSFLTRDCECSVEGTIDGVHAYITFQQHPFEDASPEKES